MKNGKVSVVASLRQPARCALIWILTPLAKKYGDIGVVVNGRWITVNAPHGFLWKGKYPAKKIDSWGSNDVWGGGMDTLICRLSKGLVSENAHRKFLDKMGKLMSLPERVKKTMKRDVIPCYDDKAGNGFICYASRLRWGIFGREMVKPIARLSVLVRKGRL